MRILHILDHSIPLHSGYSFRTLAILRHQRMRGWDTFHVTSPKQGAAEREEEVVDEWHFYRTRPSGGIGQRLPGLNQIAVMQALGQRLDNIIPRVKPDVIHAHSPVLNAIPAIRAGRRFGIPVVYEVRAFWEDAAVDHGTARENGLRYRLTRALETYALRRADAVTTICDGLRGDILQRGIPSEKITVIPNAVDIDHFSDHMQRDPLLTTELQLDGKIVLGFIGSFYAYEGLALLLQALPRMLQKNPAIRLLLVGGGPQEAALKSLAQCLGVEEQVIFTGRVPHEQVQRYYDLIDILVYPRLSMRLTDLVTPLKPLEAMAQGRLIVASDVGGHRELIRDEQTGVLFKAGSIESLASQVLGLLAAPERWSSMRRAAREFVAAERSWSNSVSRYHPVYRSVLNGTLT